MASDDVMLPCNEIPHFSLSNNYLRYSREGYKMSDYVNPCKINSYKFNEYNHLLKNLQTHYPHFNNSGMKNENFTYFSGFNPNRYQVFRRNNKRDCSDTISTFETHKIKSKQLYPDQKCDVYSKCYTSHKCISPRPFLSGNESLNQPQKKSHSDKLYGEIPHENPGKYIRPSRFFQPIWPEFPLNTGSAPRPLFMSNSDPRKYYISGYTGHVPRLRFTYGMTYPTATNHALCQFTRENYRQRELDSNSLISYRTKQTKSIKNNARLPNHVLPFLDTGLIPKYAGHIPGYKFVYGDTFGRATLKLSESRHLPTRKLL